MSFFLRLFSGPLVKLFSPLLILLSGWWLARQQQKTKQLEAEIDAHERITEVENNLPTDTVVARDWLRQRNKRRGLSE